MDMSIISQYVPYHIYIYMYIYIYIYIYSHILGCISPIFFHSISHEISGGSKITSWPSRTTKTPTLRSVGRQSFSRSLEGTFLCLMGVKFDGSFSSQNWGFTGKNGTLKSNKKWRHQNSASHTSKHKLVGGWATPLKNDGVRQLGLLFPRYGKS